MKIADLVKNFVVIYLVDITEVPEFNAMYELFLHHHVLLPQQAHDDRSGHG